MDYAIYTKEELIDMLREYTSKVRNCDDVYKWISEYGKEEVEHFGVLILDGNLQGKNLHIISKGLVNRTLVHPREVFKPAITDMATAIILFHNHPSNNLEPSEEDLELTEKLVKAGDMLGIRVMDHLIVGKYGYISMAESGYCTFR